MAQLTPEIEALVNSIIYIDCRIDAVMKILGDEGVNISQDDIESETHRIHSIQGVVKRHIIMSRMRDSKFDFR